SHSRLGNVHVAQGYLPAALKAVEADLAIAELLAAGDSSNLTWQLDLAVSCGTVGTCVQASLDRRRELLRQGLSILEHLAESNRLLLSRDNRTWFRTKLRELDETAAT